MHRDAYWRSRIPLPLVLLFVANLLLVLGAELLFFYRFPTQPDEADLTKYDAVYQDCSIINRDSVNYLNAALVNTRDGQTHLVVTKGHVVALGRGKLLYAKPVEIPESGEMSVYVKNGLHTSEIHIQDIPSGVWAVTIRYAFSGSVREATAWYMVIGGLLEALELMILYFIRKNLQ